VIEGVSFDLCIGDYYNNLLFGYGWLVVEVLCEVVFDVDVLVLFINSMEVEVIKLFVNIFLVMRVVFFNELDMFIVICGLDLC